MIPHKFTREKEEEEEEERRKSTKISLSLSPRFLDEIHYFSFSCSNNNIDTTKQSFFFFKIFFQMNSFG